MSQGGYFGQDLLLLAQEVRWSRATAAFRNESTEEGKRAVEENRCGPPTGQADLEVVEHFAVLHDVMRADENRDIQHGNRSADFVRQIADDWVHLGTVRQEQLIEACTYHSMGRLTHDVTIQTCWDADRLDLGRIGTKPSPTYLGTKIARDSRFLESAYQRSKKSFVSYTFASGS